MAKPTSTIEVHSDGSHGAHEPSLFTADVTMLILTWVTFFLLLGVLHKFAWKPILSALNQREENIKKSLDDAEKIKEEMATLEQTTKKMLEDAQSKAKDIIDQSRKAASEAAKTIEGKAREESQILMENARREIHEEKQKAIVDLRVTSADLAVELASKIIEENLDTEKNRKLVNRFIKEI